MVADRQKVPAKRVMRNGLPALQVSTVHSSGAALRVTGLTDDVGNDIIFEEEQDFNDDGSESGPEVEEEMERGKLHGPPAGAILGPENDARSGSERASMEVQVGEGSLDAPIRHEIDSIDFVACKREDARRKDAPRLRAPAADATPRSSWVPSTTAGREARACTESSLFGGIVDTPGPFPSYRALSDFNERQKMTLDPTRWGPGPQCTKPFDDSFPLVMTHKRISLQTRRDDSSTSSMIM
ncbi:hypothetical protein DXG01_011617 [Tephrocybe rancida]|nr:hypothetical protein DXG01_011617 [Tephrocybe rancida]